MLKIGLLTIFSLTFTTINSISFLCQNNPHCRCVSQNSEVLHVTCAVGIKNSRFTINIKSFDYIQINCEGWDGWEGFKFKSNVAGGKLKTLQFLNCGLSDKISLKDVSNLFGIQEVDELRFKSYNSLNGNLERHHLAGFPKVRSLVLSGNDLTNLTKDLLMDFPLLEWIDLSNNRIILNNQLFDSTPNLTRIELFNNGLTKVDSLLFSRLKKLEFLDLMGNQLTHLEDTFFKNLSSLKYLLLDINNITSLSADIFSPLSKLEVINISHNNLTYVPSNLFHDNRKLFKLLFHHNKIHLNTLPNYFLSNFKLLQEIYINNNGLKILPENLFWGSISIKIIAINDNLLKTLPMNFFKELIYLKSLDLSNNLIKNLPDFIFKRLIDLETLDLSKNNMVVITNNLFDGLTSLTTLIVENNKIKTIEPKAFYNLEKLSIAKLSNNRINFNSMAILKLNPFYNNTYLKELYLSNNNIKSFISDWPFNDEYLQILDLSYNNITDLLADDLLIPSDRITIDLRNNQIKNIRFLIEYNSVSKFLNIERDIIALIDGNPILCNCHLYGLLRTREKKEINYYYNYFKFIINDMSCINKNGILGPKIKQLHTSTYLCSENDYFGSHGICQDNCICNIRLSDLTRIMDCSNKRLNNFIIDQSKVIFVGKYPMIINLTGNFLKEIPSLQPLLSINVTTLLLSNNNITELNFEKIPIYLQVLELHNNDISEVSFYAINYIKTGLLRELTLRGNPIKCDCHTIDFYLCVQSMRFLYEDLENVTCQKMNIPLYQLTFNDFQCKSNYSSALYIFFCFVISVMITILIWYHRIKIHSFFRKYL